MNSRNTQTNRKIGCQGVVRLSRRLMQVADFVNSGSRIADIGTDHGFVPVYLAQTGRIKSALAMDVGKGPLERAKEHIREYEAWVKASQEAGSRTAFCPIEARLSNGLQELKPGEADTVIIAGMGGELEIRILEEGRHMWDSVNHWILSPQSDLDQVRQYLEANGFVIMDEAMVKEEGKFYTIMSVGRGKMEYGSQTEYRYGRRLMEKKDPVLKEYLDKEMQRVQGICRELKGSERKAMTEGQLRAYEALMQELAWIKEAQDEMR